MIRLLFVDDSAPIRRLFLRLFPRPAWEVDLAENGVEALPLIEAHDYDAIISDFRMPRMDGGELLARACDRRPDSARILVTAESDFEVAVRAVNRGEIFRLVRKPWDDDALQFAVRLGVKVRTMRREREEMMARLEQKAASLAHINHELAGLNRVLEQRVQERTTAVMESLVAALDFRDPEASRRAHRIAAIARRIATAMGIGGEALVAVEQGALLHDVGRLTIRDELYFKRGELTEDEWVELRRYPSEGFRMLRPIEFLEGARKVVLHHREHWCGDGYPGGLRGEAIAPGARIFAVAEALDAALSDPRRGPRSDGGAVLAAALADLAREAGRRYDPSVVAALGGVPSWEWLEICEPIELVEKFEDATLLQVA